MVDIAAKYGLDKSRVSKICVTNQERIDAERAERLAERQERINQAMDADTERLVSLITETTTLLSDFLGEVRSMLQKLKDEERLKPSFVLDGLDAATKAFDRVRAAALAQQKQAAGE